jgi:hypothetical protein
VYDASVVRLHANEGQKLLAMTDEERVRMALREVAAIHPGDVCRPVAFIPILNCSCNSMQCLEYIATSILYCFVLEYCIAGPYPVLYLYRHSAVLR